MADAEIVFKSGQELASLIKAREVSPVEAVRAYLERIEALNPKLNAFITVTADHALARARDAQREIAAGKYRGPLHGVPYAPKDILATKGIRTTWGANPYKDQIARVDARGAAVCGQKLVRIRSRARAVE